MRNSIAKRASIEFYFLLSHRGFEGSLQFDHANSKLDLDIRTTTENVPVGQDIRQLSGGEKSFGTSCFLFSLWDALASPLICLDEFDVYMV